MAVPIGPRRCAPSPTVARPPPSTNTVAHGPRRLPSRVSAVATTNARLRYWVMAVLWRRDRQVCYLSRHPRRNQQTPTAPPTILQMFGGGTVAGPCLAIMAYDSRSWWTATRATMNDNEPRRASNKCSLGRIPHERPMTLRHTRRMKHHMGRALNTLVQHAWAVLRWLPNRPVIQARPHGGTW